MKKVFFLFVLTALLLLSAFIPAEAAEINVIVSGKKVVFDVKPIVIDNRILVPVRAIFEALDVHVNWNDTIKAVEAHNDTTTVIIPLDSYNAAINGEAAYLGVPAKIINGRVLVPLRFVGQSFGAIVNWDNKTRTASIYFQPHTGLEVNSTKTVLPMTTVKIDKYYPIKSSNDIWIVSGNNLALYNTVENTLHGAVKFKNYIIYEKCLDDGTFAAFDTNQATMYYIDAKSLTIKTVPITGTSNWNSASISSRGEVLLWTDGFNSNNSYIDDLWKIGLDGEIIRLTNTPSIREENPQWSPDGSMIAFCSYEEGREKHPYISIVNSTGQNLRAAFDNPTSWTAGFEWSPDSSFLVCKEIRGTLHTVWAANVLSDNKQKVCEIRDDYVQGFSVSNKMIYIILNNERFAVAPVDGSGGPKYFNDPWLVLGNPKWTPDGRYLFYERFGEIWVFDPVNDTANILLKGSRGILTFSEDMTKLYEESNRGLICAELNKI